MGEIGQKVGYWFRLRDYLKIYISKGDFIFDR